MNIKKIFITVSLFFAISLIFPIAMNAQSVLPDSSKKAYGDYGASDLVDMALRIANIILGLSGSVALGVIIYGGFLMTLAGIDPKNASTGKNAIKGAAIGLVIVFSAFTAVNFVFTSAGKPRWSTAKKAPEKPYVDYTINMYMQRNCPTCLKNNGSINFNELTKTAASAPSGGDCSKYNFYFAGEERGDILKAMAMQESGCNPNLVGKDNDCGIMQLQIPTAQQYADKLGMGVKVTCDWLQQNPTSSIMIANAYVDANKSKHNDNPNHIAAGYNSGFGTYTASGKLAALATSQDCGSEYKAYECNIRPGDLVDVQKHVASVREYYNLIKKTKQ